MSLLFKDTKSGRPGTTTRVVGVRGVRGGTRDREENREETLDVGPSQTRFPGALVRGQVSVSP